MRDRTKNAWLEVGHLFVVAFSILIGAAWGTLANGYLVATELRMPNGRVVDIARKGAAEAARIAGAEYKLVLAPSAPPRPVLHWSVPLLMTAAWAAAYGIAAHLLFRRWRRALEGRQPRLAGSS